MNTSGFTWSLQALHSLQASQPAAGFFGALAGLISPYEALGPSDLFLLRFILGLTTPQAFFPQNEVARIMAFV